MLHFHKINPLVRAIGTVGAVAGLTVGITFAAQTSNTVTLTDNTLSAASVSLALADGTCPTTGAVTGTSATGMSFSKLVPGAASTPAFNFCISNTGDVPQAISMTSSTDFSTSAIPASDITLNVACGSTTATPVTLDKLATPTPVETSVAAGANDQCTATATLKSDFSGSGGSVTPFDLDFTGTPVSS